MPLLNVEDRTPEIQAIATKFEMHDLTNPDARQIASSFARLAQEILFRLRGEEREELLVETLEALYMARTAAITAILPPVRRPQFEAREAAKSTPELPAEDEPESDPEPASTARSTTARSKTARTRAAAAR